MSRTQRVLVFALLRMPWQGGQPTGEGAGGPSIVGIEGWVNSEPIALRDLRGKVVLLDFWTYTCVNCLRTLPYLQAWHQAYQDSGLVILGIHSPEFEFEKSLQNVRMASEDLGVVWPVALDNDRATWQSFGVRAWPTKVAIDTQGVIRYRNSGEGRYRETESMIRNLLEEGGWRIPTIWAITPSEPDFGRYSGITREIYGGAFRDGFVFQKFLGDPEGRSTEPREYTDPGEREDGSFYLQGIWRSEEEAIVHARVTEEYVDYLALRFDAGEANAVVRPLSDEPFRVRVTLDGGPVPIGARGADIRWDADAEETYLDVVEPRMYYLIDTPERREYELKLWPKTDSFSLHAFTFGP